MGSQIFHFWEYWHLRLMRFLSISHDSEEKGRTNIQNIKETAQYERNKFNDAKNTM